MQLPDALSSLSPKENFSLKKFLIIFPKNASSEKVSYIFSKPTIEENEQEIKSNA